MRTRARLGRPPGRSAQVHECHPDCRIQSMINLFCRCSTFCAAYVVEGRLLPSPCAVNSYVETTIVGNISLLSSEPLCVLSGTYRRGSRCCRISKPTGGGTRHDAGARMEALSPCRLLYTSPGIYNTWLHRRFPALCGMGPDEESARTVSTVRTKESSRKESSRKDAGRLVEFRDSAEYINPP